MNAETMSKAAEEHRVDRMRAEYDFHGGVRGKYALRHSEGSNVVVLDPDVAERFRTSKDVNRALRRLANPAASCDHREPRGRKPYATRSHERRHRPTPCLSEWLTPKNRR